MSDVMSDFLKLAAPGVRGLHPYQPGKPIELTLKSNHPKYPLIKVPVMQMPRQPNPVQGQAPKVLPPGPRPALAPAPPPPLPSSVPANAAVSSRQPSTQ